jgi:hypothetical protein
MNAPARGARTAQASIIIPYNDLSTTVEQAAILPSPAPRSSTCAAGTVTPAVDLDLMTEVAERSAEIREDFAAKLRDTALWLPPTTWTPETTPAGRTPAGRVQSP